MYSLKEAADAAGVTKPTIWRCIKSGKLSATKNEHGHIQVDPAELHRVYPVKAETPPETPRNIELELELRHIKELLRISEHRCEELRAERDSWRRHCENLLPPPKRTVWQRIKSFYKG